MIEASLSLIGQEVKIISPKIRLHWLLRRTVVHLTKDFLKLKGHLRTVNIKIRGFLKEPSHHDLKIVLWSVLEGSADLTCYLRGYF